MKLRPEWEGDPGEVQTCGPGFIARTHLIRQVLSDLQPDDLLDIGCGRGNVTRLIAADATRVVAAEVSADAARLARRTLAAQPHVDVLAADVLALAGPQQTPMRGAFDLVLLSEVLEHLDDDHTALQRCFQLVRPGGRLLVTVPAHQHLWTEMDDLIGHRRRYARDGLIEELERAGFRVERLLSWGFPITGFLARRSHSLRAGRLSSSGEEGGQLDLPRPLAACAALAFRALARCESVFSSSDRGIGYVALARRPLEAPSLDRAA